MLKFIPSKIISGGQTGADRGGLNAAIKLGIPHGGWCPKNRRSEDGPIPQIYCLVETSSADYSVRTRKNVKDSNATILFTTGKPTGGSAFTMETAFDLKKTFLHLNLSDISQEEAVSKTIFWLEKEKPVILNIAGSRESLSPGLENKTYLILLKALE